MTTGKPAVGAVLFDWGDTLMRVFPGQTGAMAEWPRVEVMPGVRGVLRKLAPLAILGVATNAADSEAADIRRALRRARLSSLLPRLYCFRSLGYRKSSPAFWEAVTADLGLPGERVVMVGDDLAADVEAATTCGLRAVWFNPSSAEERRGPTWLTVHRMSDLPDLLHGVGWL